TRPVAHWQSYRSQTSLCRGRQPAMNQQNDLSHLAKQIAADGFAFVHGAEMRGMFEQQGSLADWPAFAASWNDLGLDTYMADGGRYRKRRHAAFAATDDAITRKPHQPHYQSRDYN